MQRPHAYAVLAVLAVLAGMPGETTALSKLGHACAPQCVSMQSCSMLINPTVLTVLCMLALPVLTPASDCSLQPVQVALLTRSRNNIHQHPRAIPVLAVDHSASTGLLSSLVPRNARTSQQAASNTGMHVGLLYVGTCAMANGCQFAGSCMVSPLYGVAGWHAWMQTVKGASIIDLQAPFESLSCLLAIAAAFSLPMLPCAIVDFTQ